MPISDFLDMMSATVTLAAVQSRDDYGAPSFAAAVSYKAHVQYKAMRVTSRVTGHDVLASGAVWLGTLVTVLTVDMKLTLPDGSTPRIQSWDIGMDEVGNHHTKIYFS